MYTYVPYTEVASGVYLDISFYTSQRPNFPHFSSQHRPDMCLFTQKQLANNLPALRISLTKSGIH